MTSWPGLGFMVVPAPLSIWPKTYAAPNFIYQALEPIIASHVPSGPTFNITFFMCPCAVHCKYGPNYSYILCIQGILWTCEGRGHQNGPMAPLLIKCI